MAGPVFGVGIGFFLLAFVWTAALIVCLLFSRSPTKLSSLGPVSIVIALFLSLILLVIPREDQFPSEAEKAVVYDYSIVYRSSLLAVMSLFFILGLVFFLLHAMEPVQAKPLRKFIRN